MTTAELADIALDILSIQWKWMVLGAILFKFIDYVVILAAVGVVALERRKGVR